MRFTLVLFISWICYELEKGGIGKSASNEAGSKILAIWDCDNLSKDRTSISTASNARSNSSVSSREGTYCPFLSTLKKKVILN